MLSHETFRQDEAFAHHTIPKPKGSAKSLPLHRKVKVLHAVRVWIVQWGSRRFTSPVFWPSACVPHGG